MPSRGVPRRPRPSDFGDKTWVDVQAKLARWARGHYPRVDAHMMEDALQDAVVDGMTYWQTLSSSHTGDTQKNFDYAVFRGKKYLARHMRTMYRAHTEVDALDGAWDRADDAPTPDEVLVDRDFQERARGVLEEMSSGELEDFFTYLGGNTQREVAEKLDISHQTVGRRQSARRLDLQKRARVHGLS